jgi:hypothetical protein
MGARHIGEEACEGGEGEVFLVAFMDRWIPKINQINTILLRITLFLLIGNHILFDVPFQKAKQGKYDFPSNECH